MTAIAYELLEAAVNRLPEDALTSTRRAGLETFARTGFPTLKDEDWKYTNLRDAVELSNVWLQSETATLPTASLTTRIRELVAEISEGIDADWIVIANGTVIGDLPKLKGVDVTRLAGPGVNAEIIADDSMTSFNAALLRDGLYLEVSRTQHSVKPLGFLFVDDSEIDNLSQPRLIIDVEEGASIDLIEAQVSAGTNEQFANSVIQLNIAEDARVGFVRIQKRADAHIQVGKLIVELQRDAKLDYACFDIGGSLARSDVAINIVGPGADAHLHGLYLAGGKQHIDNHIRVDHRVGPAVSKEEYRGILSGHSRCVFNGKAVVHEGADGTDAEQSNHNLLLSDTAEIDTKPELEIYADDVKCAHGATVGQLDKAALFYLRSRGLGPDEAAQLLTRAFAARILSASPVSETRAHIGREIDRRLDALIDGGTQ